MLYSLLETSTDIFNLFNNIVVLIVDYTFNFNWIPNLLLLQYILPLFSIFLLIFFNGVKRKYHIFIIWSIIYWISIITLIVSCILLYNYNESNSLFQFGFELSWLSSSFFTVHFGVDGVSIALIILTNFLVSLCILVSYNTVAYKLVQHLACFVFLQFFLLLSFSVLDIFWFYIFFESILIPMFLLIGIWGSRLRRVKATYMLFVYTALGSLLLLFSIVFLFYTIGTTDVRILYLVDFPFSIEKFLWTAMFLSFCVKTPMFPFHIWLPEAHVEASTTGSVILAGILLKLGTYGMLRFLLPVFPIASKYFSIFVFILCIMGIIYISFIILSQMDLKKIIAYASVVHMASVVIGLFSFTYNGLQGAILMMVGHGLVAGGLFLSIGMLYTRFHTRLISYYNSLVISMPLFSIFFLSFTLLNIGFPGTIGFISEVLIFSSIQFVNPVLLSFLFIGYLISVIYSIWLFNRVCFGLSFISTKESSSTDSFTLTKYTVNSTDLTVSEVTLQFVLTLFGWLLGIFPIYITNIFTYISSIYFTN